MALVLASESQDLPQIDQAYPAIDGTTGALLGDSIQSIGRPARNRRPVSKPAGGGVVIDIRAFAKPPESKPEHDTRSELTRRELQWLAENQETHAGRWVALVGDKLIAEGSSPGEVYAAIASQKLSLTPLVTKVEQDGDIYFAGW